MILASKVLVNIIHAEMKDINGTAMGQMVIQLPQEETEAMRVLNYLKTAKVPCEEVNDYDI